MCGAVPKCSWTSTKECVSQDKPKLQPLDVYTLETKVWGGDSGRLVLGLIW